MSDLLWERVGNETSVEVEKAAKEQFGITHIRLVKALVEAGDEQGSREGRYPSKGSLQVCSHPESQALALW